MLNIGMTIKISHRVCPGERNNGKNQRNWQITWVKVTKIKEETQNCIAFNKHRLKCLDSRIRWKIDTSSSMWNDKDEAKEFNIWLKFVGDGHEVGAK